jgi:hypothetical protein
MKRCYSVLLLSFVFLLIAGCSKLEIQPDPLYSSNESALKSAKEHFVPFKGEFMVYYAEDGPGDHPMYLEGGGKATHLGKTFLQHGQTWVGTEGSGDLLFTAANGDELCAIYTNSMVFEFPMVIMEGEATFTSGGTGRFEYATGGFEIEATWNVLTNEGTATYIGEIMYKRN